MNRIVCTILIVAGLSFLSACNNPQPEANKLLTQAEQLMDDHPDSAMLLIDSIFYPEKSFNKKDYMRYWVARVQARYKNYVPVTEDTFIFEARDYFTAHAKDLSLTSRAYFYSGCVYREQGDFEQAMQHYKDAEMYAVKAGNLDLEGLIQYNIGNLLKEQGLEDKALLNYQQAERIYARLPGNAKRKQVQCLGAIGRQYSLLEQRDSAFFALHKGLELAESIKDRELQSLMTQNLSVTYSEEKKYDEAAFYLHKSYDFNNDSLEVLRYYLNFAELYANTGQNDSLLFYTNKLEQSIDAADDPFLKGSAYRFLAETAANDKNFEKAYDFQLKWEKWFGKIMEDRVSQSVYKVQQKYDYEKQQSEYDRSLLHRQRLIIILLSFFLLASLLSLFLLRRVVQQRNKMLSLQNTIRTLNKTAKDLQKRESVSTGLNEQLRETLLWKFNVLHKSSLLKSEMEKIEKMDTRKALAIFNRIVHGENKSSEWSTLVDTIDELHLGLSQFIRNTYPQFTDTEYKVCMLSYAELPSKEIALLINQSVHTVNMARTHIRQKMNLQETGADFCAVIKQSYEENLLK